MVNSEQRAESSEQRRWFFPRRLYE